MYIGSTQILYSEVDGKPYKIENAFNFLGNEKKLMLSPRIGFDNGYMRFSVFYNFIDGNDLTFNNAPLNVSGMNADKLTIKDVSLNAIGASFALCLGGKYFGEDKKMNSDTLRWGIKTNNTFIGNNVFVHRKFRIDFSPFTSFSKNSSANLTHLFSYIEPKFSILPQLSIGTQLGGMFLTGYADNKAVILDNGLERQNLIINPHLSSVEELVKIGTFHWLVTLDWHFNPQKYFRPFVGIGIGEISRFILGSGPILYDKTNDIYYKIKGLAEEKFKNNRSGMMMFRFGFDVAHFRICAFYNLIFDKNSKFILPKIEQVAQNASGGRFYAVEDTEAAYSSITINGLDMSSFGGSVAVYIGGGKKRK